MQTKSYIQKKKFNLSKNDVACVSRVFALLPIGDKSSPKSLPSKTTTLGPPKGDDLSHNYLQCPYDQLTRLLVWSKSMSIHTLGDPQF